MTGQPDFKDPLQFGSEEDASPAAPADGYGHDLLGDDHAPEWQHYPEVPQAAPVPAQAQSEPSSSVQATGSSSPPQQHLEQQNQRQHQQEQQPRQHQGVHYPAVPAPAAKMPPLHSPNELGNAASLSSAVSLDLPSPSSRHLGPANLKVAVHAPRQMMGPSMVPGVQEGYMTYEVTTATSLPNFSAQQLSVRRRFKDFVSLSKMLPRHHPGCFLPARPHKNALESRRMTARFIEERRAALERYMNRLACHPIASKSEPLRVFLEADGNLRTHPQWRALYPRVPSTMAATARFMRQLVGVQRAAPSPADVVNPASQSRDMYRMLHENVAQMRGSFKGATVSPEEVALRDATALLEDLRQGLHAAVRSADTWVQRLSELSAAYGETATALDSLSQFEQSYNMNAHSQSVATQACVQARALSSAAEHHTNTALQPLHEYDDCMPNVMAALQRRERALLTAQTLGADLADAKSKLQAAQLSPATAAKKVNTLKQEVGQLEEALMAAEAEYGRQAARNIEELGAFKTQRGREMCAMVRDLATVQQHWGTKAGEMWQAAAQRLPEGALVTAGIAQYKAAVPAGS